MAFRPRIDAPLHAILVHFTVALSVSSLGFDVAATIFRIESLADAAWWTLFTGTVATTGTVASGIVSRFRLSMEEGRARSFLRAHMALGPIAFGTLIAATAWRSTFAGDGSFASVAYLAAMAGVVVLMTIQGYLGGELVYRFGAEVRGAYPRLPVEPEHAVAIAAPDQQAHSPQPDDGRIGASLRDDM
ncbi:MAG: DUF2231 domain-containing protein [Gemmatimonadaceae bacterium]